MKLVVSKIDGVELHMFYYIGTITTSDVINTMYAELDGNIFDKMESVCLVKNLLPELYRKNYSY